MDGSLYDGNSLLTTGPCSLSSDTTVTTGSIAVDHVAGLLNRRFLTLQLASGEKLNIKPRRIEHSAGKSAMLLFDVEP